MVNARCAAVLLTISRSKGKMLQETGVAMAGLQKDRDGDRSRCLLPRHALPPCLVSAALTRRGSVNIACKKERGRLDTC